MTRQLFAIKQPTVSVSIDGSVVNTGDPIYSVDQDVFHYKGKTYVAEDCQSQPALNLEDDAVSQWVHRYKDGSPRNIGAICAKCDIWNGMMTPRCPWCGRIMKNALYSKEGKFLGPTRKPDNQ
ncbi:hypothetical protein [uncultured Duncaniella sp.]|uniref:hypothetical protein n=1 Tax=uncultured Duncaniella sp. TaxID=2768039 RepID=UPI0026151253|nr:hypothetical protein [uncultured Duncaniella sp.]